MIISRNIQWKFLGIQLSSVGVGGRQELGEEGGASQQVQCRGHHQGWHYGRGGVEHVVLHLVIAHCGDGQVGEGGDPVLEMTEDDNGIDIVLILIF